MQRFSWILLLILALIFTGCAAHKPEPISPLPPIMRHKAEGFKAKESPPLRYEPTEEEGKKAKEERILELAKQPRVNQVFTSRNLPDALADIQLDTGVNIIPADNVQGPINIYLDDIPLERALNMLCFPGGYTWKKVKSESPDGKDYYIVGSAEPGDPASLPLIVTEKIRTNRPAQEVYELLANPSFQPYISVATPRVTAAREETRRAGVTPEYMPLISEPSGESNELVVVGPRDIVDRIKHDIKTIVDQPLHQIAIQVLFTESQFDKSKRIGIDWSQGLDMSVTGTGTFTKGWDFGWQSNVMGQLLSSIQAMVRKGKLELKDFPQVVTREGSLAAINLQTQQWIRLDEPRAFGPERAYYFRERTERFTYGTMLMVRPIITDNGDIILKLAVEVDDVAGVNKDGLPAINKRAVTNEIKIASGETVIIGGLYRHLFRSDKAGIAALSKVPVLDVPLSMRTGDNQVKELTVFITARVLEPEWVVKAEAENVRVEKKEIIKEVEKEVPVKILPVDPEEWKKALDRSKEEINGE